jgi:hypothetical protein
MKKINLIIIVVYSLFYSTQLYTQNELDLTLGLNRSNIVWTNLEEAGWQYKSDYFVGLRTVILKKKKIELSTEVQYSRKGWRINEIKETFDYIDAMHLFNYKPIKSISLYGGINTGLLLNEKEVIADRIIDLGLISGFSFGSNDIKIFGQYNYGLLNNELNTPGIKELGIKALNSNLQLGFRFSLLNDSRKKIVDKEKEKIVIEEKEKIVIEKKEKIVIPKYFELGVSTTNFFTFKALLKQKRKENEYHRYDFSYSEINYSGITSNRSSINFNTQFGFGLEKRKQFDNIQILSGVMYQMGLSYRSGNSFEVNPFLGYLVGAQYCFKSGINFGIEIIPGIKVNIIDYNNSTNTLNAAFSFRNAPTLFVSYKLGNKSKINTDLKSQEF